MTREKDSFVSIIILTKNAGSMFARLLKRLYMQSYKNFEIILIDSGSTDNTLNIGRKYNCRVYEITPEEFHHSRTRNLGAKLAEGDYLVYLTQDVFPLSKNLLQKLVLDLSSNDKIAAVYGRQIAYPNANLMDKFFYSFFYPRERKLITPNALKQTSRLYITSAFISDVCAAIKKDVWSSIKFNEKIMMAEDKAWAIDALQKGYWILYDPEVKVYHSHNYSLVDVFRRRFDDGVAMKQICGASYKTADNFYFREYLRYLTNELKYIYRENKLTIPYMLIYEFLKVSGFFLGSHYIYLPRWLVPHFSRYPNWWKSS